MSEPEEGLASAAEKRILVIDDDESVRELLDLTLGKEGFQVELAVDGEEGLARIEKNPPDLILLDLMMPKYGGYEVLRQLQVGENGRIPIIVITGRCADKTTREMIQQESNVVDFMEKPLKPGVLGMNVHGFLKTAPPVSRLKPLGDF